MLNCGWFQNVVEIGGNVVSFLFNLVMATLNFDWFGDVSPAAAKVVFLVLFVVIGLLVLMVPKEYIYQGVERPRWWHNLKLWAWGVLSFIFAVYWVF